MRILAFAASFRRDSWNKKLLALAAGLAREAGAEIDLAEFREFEMPLYDGDLQTSAGIPAGAQELGRRITAADGVVLASPEYNYSVPGTIKNAIDWVSRIRPLPIRGKTGFLLSASPGQVGGIRGLWQLRIPLEGLGMLVYPDMYTLPLAAQAFDERGQLMEPERLDRLRKMMAGYLQMTRKLVGS
jgi:chromate reductase, NAD(P)H dehydrogenase (quinone)